MSYHDRGNIIFCDVPGIGETQSRDEDYIPLYQSLFTECDLIIWVIKSDDRAYAEIQKTLREVNSETPLMFALSNADKIAPTKGWNWETMQPSLEQETNLKLKEHEVSKELKISTNNIVAFACDDENENRNYNLKVLLEKIMLLLPNKTKASFYKATSEEAKSEESKRTTQKGTLDYIFENLGKIVAPFVPLVSKLVVEVLTEKDSLKKIFDTGLEFFKKFSK
ncbi:hypothetical protein FAI41_07095 [Acetobacteraceae bacterium]|nr:hypothetical protein FAI41_07095 [Acetobacteraceae bacterium]